MNSRTRFLALALVVVLVVLGLVAVMGTKNGGKGTVSKPTSVTDLLKNKVITSMSAQAVGAVQSVNEKEVTITSEGASLTFAVDGDTRFAIIPANPVGVVSPAVNVFKPENIKAGDTIQVSLNVRENQLPVANLISMSTGAPAPTGTQLPGGAPVPTPQQAIPQIPAGPSSPVPAASPAQ